MADYGCWPLWELSSEAVGNIDPDDLPISPQLRHKLLEWARLYDETLKEDYPPDSGFKSPALELAFKQSGRELARRLQEELGPEYLVVPHRSLEEGV